MVSLIHIGSVNCWSVKMRTGKPVEAERLPKYVVMHRDGRIMGEFRRLASARKWCRQNNAPGPAST